MRVQPNQTYLLRNLFYYVGIEKIEDLDRLSQHFFGDRDVIEDSSRACIEEALEKWSGRSTPNTAGVLQ